MNTDQIKGKLEQAIGHIKQGVGEVLGDDKTANEGLGDQVKGAAHETVGNVKDAAHTTTATHEPEAADRSAEIRHNLSDKIADIKNAVNERVDEYKAEHNR